MGDWIRGVLDPRIGAPYFDRDLRERPDVVKGFFTLLQKGGGKRG